MIYNLENSKALFKKGSQHLVGSVNSPVRAFKSVGGTPVFINKGKADRVYDIDNNEYIDLVGSYGPMILGHAHEEVLNSVKSAAEKSFSFGASSEKEVELAETIKSSFDSIDNIRFVNSGTEAVFSAIRLARAYTNKNKIIKFSGCYHGHTDALLVAAGSGVVTLGLPGSKGVPEKAVSDTLVAIYNDIDSVEMLFNKFNNEIAAVIIEPVAGNMGVVLPQNNFLLKLNKLTKQHNALFIADEVMTGYRAHFGGAQTLYDIQPDLTCLGKVIGGGFPVGAFGGKLDIMQMLAPNGPVYQAGTLSGNPIAMAAGISTLNVLKKANPYERFSKQAQHLKNHYLDVANKKGLPISVNTYGSMISAFFNNKEIKNFKEAQTSDTKIFSKYFWNMMSNGVFLPPSQFEACFLSTPMNDLSIEMLCNAITKSFNEL